MNLAGFCRGACRNGTAPPPRRRVRSAIPRREIVYGMPYDEWRKQHQKEATAERRPRSSFSAEALTEHRPVLNLLFSGG
jgi:hypothetical protein